MSSSSIAGVQSRSAKRVKSFNEIKYVEFYSGIGGWTMALEDVAERCQEVGSIGCVRFQRVAAFDHSDLSVKVFEHNFGAQSERPQDIKTIPQKVAENWGAHVWAMSPPCQPHTRQHNNQAQDLKDPRSASFLHLCDLLQNMADSTLPEIILIENVVGFEGSRSFQRWRQVMSSRNYHVGHFHLTPTQLGIPNDRPRYFGVAVREEAISNQSTLHHCVRREAHSALTSPPNIATYIMECKVRPAESVDHVSPLSNFLEPDVECNGKRALQLPETVIKSKSAWCFDIVTPADRRSACFTHSYGRYVKGTGSILYEGKSTELKLLLPQQREYDENWTKGLDISKLRYFSGLEMARLMGFAGRFRFPPECSLKSQWKLVGNSLNVQIASRVAELGLRLVYSQNEGSVSD